MSEIDRLTYRVWPVAAIPSLGGADCSPSEDGARKEHDHQALAQEFSEKMAGLDVTTATISPEAVAVRDAEESGATVTWAPLDRRIAAYLHNTKG